MQDATKIGCMAFRVCRPAIREHHGIGISEQGIGVDPPLSPAHYHMRAARRMRDYAVSGCVRAIKTESKLSSAWDGCNGKPQPSHIQRTIRPAITIKASSSDHSFD